MSMVWWGRGYCGDSRFRVLGAKGVLVQVSDV